MEIKKAEKLFKKIDRISKQEIKRLKLSYPVNSISVNSNANTFFCFISLLLFCIGIFSLIALHKETMYWTLILSISLLVSIVVTYFVFGEKAMKNFKRKKRWRKKIEKLKEKKQNAIKDLELLMIGKVDDYFNEIQELDQSKDLEELSEKFVDEIIKLKKEKILASTVRSKKIRDVAILEKEVNKKNKNSLIVNT